MQIGHFPVWFHRLQQLWLKVKIPNIPKTSCLSVKLKILKSKIIFTCYGNPKEIVMLSIVYLLMPPEIRIYIDTSYLVSTMIHISH